MRLWRILRSAVKVIEWMYLHTRAIFQVKIYHNIEKILLSYDLSPISSIFHIHSIKI